MFKFTIKYFHERWENTGNINPYLIRTASVYANNKEEAVSKVKAADNEFISISELVFDEMVGEGE